MEDTATTLTSRNPVWLPWLTIRRDTKCALALLTAWMRNQRALLWKFQPHPGTCRGLACQGWATCTACHSRILEKKGDGWGKYMLFLILKHTHTHTG
eukprot:1153536-Pelagomonas_calceolata.AAC.4